LGLLGIIEATKYRLTTNCYGYAIGQISLPPNEYLNDDSNTFKLQPGYFSGKVANNTSCEAVVSAAKSDGLIPTTNGICPTNYHKVTPIVAPGVDFHWLRFDQTPSGENVISHKRGLAEVTTRDASGAVIKDISTGNFNYSGYNGPNYSDICESLCSKHLHIIIIP
jgi:hypothetical protein